MADFDVKPQQTQPQEYLNLSRPLSPIYPYLAADKSKEILYQGLGRDIVTGAEAADAVMKRNIDYQLHSQIDPQTEGFTEALKTVRAQQQAQVPQNAQPDMHSLGGQQVIGAVPQQVLNGLDKVDTLHQGVGQGKVSQTQYLGNLYSIAKNMRAQYPGYRDYIDQRMHEITGRPIANEYISSLKEDINREGQGGIGNKVQEQRLTALMESNKEGTPGADRVLQGFVNGYYDGAYVDRFINQSNAYKYQAATLKAATADQTASDNERGRNAVDYVNLRSNKVVSDIIRESLAHMGIDTDNTGTIPNLNSLLSQFAGNSAKAGQAATYFSAAYKQAHDQLWSEFTTPDKNGNSVLHSLGDDPDRLEKLIDGNLTPLKGFITQMTNGDYGLASYTENLIKHLIADRQLGLYKDKDVGNINLSLAAMSKSMGPGGAPWFNSFATNQLAKSNISKSEERAFANGQEQLMLFPPPGQEPKPVSQVIKDTPQKSSPQVFDDYIRTIKYIADPNTPMEVRMNAAKAFFGPGNSDFMDNFKTDYTDPQTGRRVPAKYSVFTRMTSPDVTKGMWELGQQDPNVWQMYKNWTEENFAFKLFTPDIKQMNDVPVDHELKFNPALHHFTLEQTGTQSHDVASNISVRFYQNILDNVNIGLDRLYNVEKEAVKGKVNATDIVNSYLLSVLRSQGFSPSHPSAKAIIDGVRETMKSMNTGAPSTLGGELDQSQQGQAEIDKERQRQSDVQSTFNSSTSSTKDQGRVLPGGIGASQ